MLKRAYIRVMDDGRWALFAGDGTEDSPELLAMGNAFEPGEPIREVMAGLEAWAASNDYEIVPAAYSPNEGSLDDLFADDE